MWDDEFDGEAIDLSKWSHEVNCWGGGNNEQQCYTDRAENSYVEGGMLHIVARQEAWTGPAVNQDDPGYDENVTASLPYTSARLRTKEKADWTYGRFEIRAKLPQGDGLWPAIWMLPTDYVYGGWPTSGEIDIMEAVNPNAGGGNEIHGTLHYGALWPNQVNTGIGYEPEGNVWEEFHTYAVEWEEGEIRWFVDEKHFATQTQDGWYTYYWGGQEVGYKLGEGAAPFDQNFHLLLNVAVGGNWPGMPDGTATFPQEMVVDYVKVYECSVDPITGQGCDENVDSSVTPLPGVPAPEQQIFTLYEDGPATLTLDANGTEVLNTLRPAVYDGESHEGEVASNAGYDMDGNMVWDLNFMMLPANAFLLSGDMSEVEGVNDGFQLASTAQTGEIKFDLYVEAIEDATELHVKLDSGWPNVSYRPIEIPPTGGWTTVSVPFNMMQGTVSEWGSGQVNYSNVVSPFVIEPIGGTAHVKVDNIRITCLGNCAIDPIAPLETTFDIFADGAVSAVWDEPGIAKYEEAANHITWKLVTDTDRPDSEVLEISFSDAGNGIFYFQDSAKDAAAFGADGVISFDIKILDVGTSAGEFSLRVDCVYESGCTSGDVLLDPISAGTWQTIKVPVSTFVSRGLNLSKVDTPLVISPKWGAQSGVVFRLDNVRWEISGASELGGGTGIPEKDVITDTFNILIDGVPDTRWADIGLGAFETDGGAAGHVEIRTILDEDTTHATGIVYSETAGVNSIVFVKSGTPADLSAFASNGGYLEFDIKLWSYGLGDADIVVKMESGDNEGTGDYVIQSLTPEVWTTVQVPIADMITQPNTSAAFDLSDVETPFSILAEWNNQRGVQFDIDNVRWVVPTP